MSRQGGSRIRSKAAPKALIYLTFCSLRLSVRTPPFHGGESGSIPLGSAKSTYRWEARLLAGKRRHIGGGCRRTLSRQAKIHSRRRAVSGHCTENTADADFVTGAAVVVEMGRRMSARMSAAATGPTEYSRDIPWVSGSCSAMAPCRFRSTCRVPCGSSCSSSSPLSSSSAPPICR